VRGTGECQFEVTLADVAERAENVRPDLDPHDALILCPGRHAGRSTAWLSRPR
jgi:hypothetical protein